VIRLRLLGSVELRLPEGAEATEVLKQSKRLALLAYLAAAEPVRFHRRDSLLGLFWPELDEEHARGALRRALHFLRRHVSDDIVVSRGDEVGLTLDLVWCDVLGFRDAVRAGRLAEALDLYRGDLLGGLYVSSAPEFERWLDREREHLRAQATRAARMLSQQTEANGDLEGAASWAKRALQLTPDDEAAVRRLLTLLDQTGDRATALRTYDDFARRLGEDLDLTPAPETMAVVKRIRTHREAERAPRPVPHEPANPNVIAVCPFSVRGTPDVAFLREGMVDLLSAKLDGAGELRTVDPHALLRRLRDEQAIDPELGRSVARSFGAGAFLLGSIVAADDRLHLTATLYELESERTIRAETEAAREAGIFEIVDDLVRQFLAARITSLGGQIGKLAATTTESVTALKAYLEGERAFRLGHYFDATRLYEQALALDESFALGAYRLGAALAACGMPDAAREASARAHALRGRLAPHAQRLVEAQAAWFGPSPADAETLYQRLLAVRPDDVESWFLLGNLQFDLNPCRGRSATEAERALRKAVELDPRHAAALAHLARVAALAGRLDDAVRFVDRHLALSPSGDQALAMRGIRAFAMDDPAARSRLLTELAAAPPLVLATAFSDIALYATDVGTAQQLAQAAVRALPGGTIRAVASVVGAHLSLATGDLPGALRSAREAERLDRAFGLEHRAFLCTLPFIEVDPPTLDVVRSDLERWDPSTDGAPPVRPNVALAVHDGIHAHLREYLLGQLDVREHEFERAERRAEACERLPAPPAAGAMPRNLGAGIRARIAYERGDAAHGLKQLERVRVEGWFEFALVSPFFGLAPERFLRGQVLTALGRFDEARGWLSGLAQRSVYEIVYRDAARTLVGPVV
jgi:serine/threonine-protein kinase